MGFICRCRIGVEQICEVESRGNTDFEQSMEEKLVVSVVKINGLQKEKMGHLVEKQTGFFGNILPKLLE